MATGSIKTGQWSSVENATLPYTAKKDGILYANLRPTSSALAYYYIDDETAGQTVGNVVSRDGVRAQQAIPIRRGHIYKLNTSSNVNTVSLTAYYF